MAESIANLPYPSAIVADGWSRLLAGIRKEVLPGIQQTIEQTVAEKYAPQLADAGWFARIQVHRKMRAEVARRIREEIDRLMPSDDALF